MRVAEPADGDFGLYGNNIMEYSGNTDPHQKIANGSENRFKFGLHFKYTEYSISTEYVIKTTKENCIHKDLYLTLVCQKWAWEKSDWFKFYFLLDISRKNISCLLAIFSSLFRFFGPSCKKSMALMVTHSQSKSQTHSVFCGAKMIYWSKNFQWVAL